MWTWGEMKFIFKIDFNTNTKIVLAVLECFRGHKQASSIKYLTTVVVEVAVIDRKVPIVIGESVIIGVMAYFQPLFAQCLKSLGASSAVHHLLNSRNFCNRSFLQQKLWLIMNREKRQNKHAVLSHNYATGWICTETDCNNHLKIIIMDISIYHNSLVNMRGFFSRIYWLTL